MKCEFYLSGLPVEAFPNRPSERISRRVFFRRFVRPDTNRLPPVCGGPTGQRGPGKLQAPSEPAYNAHFSYLSSYCLQIDLSIRTRPIEKCHANGTCYLRLTDVCHPITTILYFLLYCTKVQTSQEQRGAPRLATPRRAGPSHRVFRARTALSRPEEGRA